MDGDQTSTQLITSKLTSGLSLAKVVIRNVANTKTHANAMQKCKEGDAMRNTLSIEELKEMYANILPTGMSKYSRAIAELIAIRELKGDQVPVAFTGSGSLAAIKGGHEGHIWGASAEAHPVPLYDRPQKPVVPCPTYCPHCSYSLHPEKAQEERNAERKAAIEASGGIVKDGE